MRAGDRGIFDELYRRFGIAHPVAAVGSRLTTSVQSPLFGAGIWVSGASVLPAALWLLPASPPQPAKASEAAAISCRGRYLPSSLRLSTYSADDRASCRPPDPTAAPSPEVRPRASDSRQARSSGSTTSRSESPISTVISAARRRRRTRPCLLRLNRSLPEAQPLDRGIAEETVDPLDDRRRDVLHHRRVRPLDDQGQNAPALLARREADRFRRGDRGVAAADDLGPAADDRGLDEAEAAEGGAADLGQKVADRAHPPRARRLGRRLPRLRSTP